MRRALPIVVVFAVIVVAVVLIAARAGGGHPYEVRAIFDNADFVIPGEDVKVAGVKVGRIADLDVTPSNQAAVVLEIDQVRRLIYVHVMDVGSDRAVKRFYDQVSQIERLLIRTFERESDWRPATRETT